MGLEGLIWVIPVLTALGVACLGGLFALIGWIKIATDPRRTSDRKIPMALYAFSASVCMDIAVYAILWARRGSDMPQGMIWKIELSHFILSLGPIVSLLFLLISIFLVRRDSSSARGVVKAGSIVLFVVNVVGFILFLLAFHEISTH